MTAKGSVTWLVAFWLATPECVAAGQTPGDTTSVFPGDTVVDPERLVPHRITWRVTRRDPDGGSTVQGLWTDTWVRSTDGGQPVFVFRQLFVDTVGAVLQDNETVFEAATFRAVRSTQHLPPSGARVAYRYAGDTASGTLHPSAGAEARTFQVVFTEPVWDPLLPVSMLLPLERVESGAVLRYPIWNQAGPGADVTWRVARVDSVGTVVQGDERTTAVWHLTVTVAAAPNTVTRVRQIPGPPYFPWFVVERPGQTREWTLVDWEPYARSARLP